MELQETVVGARQFLSLFGFAAQVIGLDRHTKIRICLDPARLIERVILIVNRRDVREHRVILDALQSSQNLFAIVVVLAARAVLVGAGGCDHK